MARLMILIGTNKGAFLLDGDQRRQDWRLRGPFCDATPVNHMIGDPEAGTIWAGGGTKWHGHGVWRSRDLGASWTRSEAGIEHEAAEGPVTSVWSLARAHGRLWAGTGPAALFVSDDEGESFTHVEGLQAHPSRPDWHGGGAGLILHSLVPDPADPARLWIGMSSVGVFETRDGGASWTPRNRGIRADYLPEGQRYPELGQCVHSFARAPGPGNRFYQQNHCGMYRSDDGGRSWVSIEAGLPSSFGFPVAVHPRDPDTVFLIPLNDQSARHVPEGRAAVWRSRDEGESWSEIARHLPVILSVETLRLG